MGDLFIRLMGQIKGAFLGGMLLRSEVVRVNDNDQRTCLQAQHDPDTQDTLDRIS